MQTEKNDFFGLANLLSVQELTRPLLKIFYALATFLLLGGMLYFVFPSPLLYDVSLKSFQLALVLLVAILLLRRRMISQAVLLTFVVCGLILAWSAWHGRGVTGTAFLISNLIVLGVTMYWGQRIGFLSVLVLLVLGLVLIGAEGAGWRRDNFLVQPDWFVLAVLFSVFSLTSFMVGIMLKHIKMLVFQARQNEEEVRRLNAELEARVAERTAQLAESERLLNIISTHVKDIIWTTDLQLNTTYATASAARLRGFDMDELINEPLHKAITPESLAQAAHIFEEEMQKEASGTADPNRSRIMHFDYYRKDGSTIRIEVHASFLRDEQGNPIGLTGVSRDISTRSWMEKALLESEERYRKITSVISDYSYSAVIDNQNVYRPEWVAGAFAEITGYRFDEYLAEGGWENLLHPDSVEQDMADRDKLCANREVDGSVLKIRRKDGETRWVRNFAYPVWNMDENRLAGVYGGVQDITEQVEAEQRLKALNDELEKRVVERTIKLENALSELESFSYSISHDLRAPLRAINGYAGILLADYKDGFSPEVVEMLKDIKENGQRTGQLVDGLLRFLHSGSEPVERQLLAPGEIVRDVLNRLQAQYEGRQVEIILQDLPECSANRLLLDKVFEDLIGNAIKFTRHCEVAQIEIGAMIRDAKTIYFVRDNGVGFDMKYYDKLFGVFQRLHHVSEFEGIGASLAIVQRIVNRHGGRVWAEAKLNKGATFFFSLE